MIFPPSPANELPGDRPAEKENRFEIQVDHRVPVAFREGQGIMAADNSGVVDQNIDPAHRRHRLVDQTAHIILLAEIRLNGVKAAAQRQHLGGRIMGNFTVDADDIAPGLRQAQRHSLSQAGIATGHDGDLTRQVEGVQYHIHLCQLIYWRTMTPPVTSIEEENKITIKMKRCFDFVAGGVTAIVAPASGLNRASSQQ